MTIVTKLEIESIEYADKKNMTINKDLGDFNSAGNFSIVLDNDNGKLGTTFNINDEVVISADKDVATATTNIFTGIVEDIKYSGKPNKEILTLTGRDFSAILQDILVEPRIFTKVETSSIVRSIMAENVSSSLVTVNNVNGTSTTIPKITFNGVSVFDALRRLADLSGFFFFVDVNKDLHFEEREAVSSGKTFDNTNVLSSSFRESDHEMFNRIIVIGDRQLTGAEETFTITDNGSVFELEAKPFNTVVTYSGATNTVQQPGGILNIDDPNTENIKYLVDFHQSSITLTSGTTAGDNILPNGSIVIINYQRSTPLISTDIDTTSVNAYGPKDKKIIDRNIKDLDEANDVVSSFLAEHKDPLIQGKLSINGVLDITPGNTAVINLPFQNQNNQTYSILSAKYNFNVINNLSDNVLSISVNKKINDFVDIMKNEILRLRALENAEVETSFTTLETSTGSIGISGTNLIISQSIGSAFYFNVTNHDILNSPSSLLGVVQGGSRVFQNGVEI